MRFHFDPQLLTAELICRALADFSVLRLQVIRVSAATAGLVYGTVMATIYKARP